VFITSTASEEHFDVLHVLLDAESQSGERERLKIAHPWEFQDSFHVCAGKVILEDRQFKKEEAFIFGGQISIQASDLYTKCLLVSPAPILEITQSDPIKVLFPIKVEALLAEIRANFSDDRDFDSHLFSLDPIDLCIACINELIEGCRTKPHQENADLQFLHFLQKEKYRLTCSGLIEDNQPTLDELFKA
jgi:hypothetical protein